jgi:outer membrane protein assembly factor BamB
MKILANSVMTFLLICAAAPAQNPVRVYTEPAVPSQESLDRLNLKLGWRVYLPTDRRRDGIFSVQVVDNPGQRGQQVLVQTRSGVVIALDGETGVTQWRARIGNPYTVSNLLGYNSPRDPEAGHGSIFAINGIELYALDRVTGVIQWQFTLPHAPTAAPVADAERIYVTMTGRLDAYELPREIDTTPAGAEKRLEALPQRGPGPTAESVSTDQAKTASVLGSRAQGIQAVSAVSSIGQSVRSVGPLATLGARGQVASGGLQPQFLWEYLADSRLELSPLYTSNFILVASYNGVFYAMTNQEGRHLYRLQAGPPLTAPLGQLGPVAYVASEDHSVYALDIDIGRVLWRFAAGGPVKRRPLPTEKDVFVSSERAGLYRLDRQTGDTIWRNNDAERFVAANTKYVYAADQSGRLLILDLARGNLLTNFDAAREFVVPITNSLTDRIFLASNDGLLVCLHDRDSPKAIYLAIPEESAPAPAKKGGKAPAPEKVPKPSPAKPKISE